MRERSGLFQGLARRVSTQQDGITGSAKEMADPSELHRSTVDAGAPEAEMET